MSVEPLLRGCPGDTALRSSISSARSTKLRPGGQVYTGKMVLGSLTVALVAAAMGGVEAAYPPADPKATPEVRQLLRRLKALQGKALVSGQTDLPDAQWIERETGKLPVILALDFMHAPKRMGGRDEDLARAKDWAKAGGVVSYQWHWVSPSGAKDMGSGFYAKSTTFDLEKALANPGSDDYRGLIQDIDDVAAQLKVLAKAKVPVLFRPLHEAQGKWFWWGAKGAAPCVALYRLMFRRMTEHHGLHNLAWVWTAYPPSQNKGNPVEWYPGDAMVDIIGSDYCEKPTEYAELVALTGGKKMVALTETMNAPDPEKALKVTPWAYWVTWARRDWNDRSPGDMKKAMAHPKTVTRERFSGM